MEASRFAEVALDLGIEFYSGVPCSYLAPLIDHLRLEPRATYVGAASEGEAVAIAAGAWLAGRTTAVLCQNSGLGNAVNPLTSLNAPFLIPTLLITTWRGEPGEPDEPQHTRMGEITPTLLGLIGAELTELPRETAQVDALLRHACHRMATSGAIVAILARRQDFSGPSPTTQMIATGSRKFGELDILTRGEPRPSRTEVLRELLAMFDERTAVIATTGKCGRELFTLSDRPQHLYQVGSMGCASGMALGVALNTSRPVVVLDGDGAALMKLGTLATIGAEAPSNLLHILLDNGVHDSTGGQATASSSTDFARIAQACGYRYAADCDGLEGLAAAWTRSWRREGPSFVRVRIRPGSLEELGRPTISPSDVARRFREFVCS